MRKITLLYIPIILLFTAVVGHANYTGQWVSVTVSNTTLETEANYTLEATNPNSTGNATSNSYVPAGETVEVTFPAGFVLSTVSGGTVNGTAITSVFTTTATTISFETPVAIAKNETFTIILNDITNHNEDGCYALSMAIDNETGTQNLFSTGENSQFALGDGLCYCTSNASSTSYSYISNVTFNTIDNSSSGCVDYTDFTNISTIIAPTTSHELTITKYNDCTGTTQHTGRFSAWIDWNRNGVFEADEQVLSDESASHGPITVTVEVPVDAAIGTTRMRCIFREGTTAPPACGEYSTWGETEDYSIVIDELNPCTGTPDPGTTSIDPNTGCEGQGVKLSSADADLNEGLTYQWQQSTDGGTTWSDIGPSMDITPSDYTDYPSESSSYRLHAFCVNSGESSVSNVVEYTLDTGGLTEKNWIGSGAGGTGTDFNEASNWDPAGVPSPCDSIRIILNGGVTITMSDDAVVGAMVYTVSGNNLGVLDFVSNYTLTINGTTTINAVNNNSEARIRLRRGGIYHRGDCVYHTTGDGITYVRADGGSPGFIHLAANLTVGSRGRTAAGVEPLIIFDGEDEQSWILNNTSTYFLGESVVFGRDNSPVVVLGGSGTYTEYSVYDGNVEINNNTIVKGMNLPIDRLTGTGTFFMDSGSKLELNYEHDMPAPYTYNLDANSTVEYLGVSTAQSVNGITYGHLISGGSGTKTAAANMIIAGNFLIRDGSNYAGSTRTHNLAGNFTNDGVFTQGTSTFIMDGTNPQVIAGTSITTFHNLTINHTSTGVTLNQQANVNNHLALTNGVVFTSGANFLQINDGATSDEGSDASHVDGPMRKIGGTDFVFPSGNQSVWARIAVRNLTANSTFEARYIHEPAPNPEDIDVNADFFYVSKVEHWILDRISGGNADVDLHWESAARSGITGPETDLRVARFDAADAEWKDEGNTANDGLDPGWVRSGTVDTFSPFTFASITEDLAVNPLPIDLLNFNVSKGSSGDVVNITWETGSELNNDYFTIERSKDGINFDPIARIEGAGNSTTRIRYQDVDRNPNAGVNYYRLKQTDYDDRYSYSEAKSVNINSSVISDITLYPNPVSSTLEMNFELSQSGNYQLKIVDITGRLIHTESVSFNKGRNRHQVDVRNLGDGIYFLSITNANTDDALKVRKFIKQ